MDEITRTKDIYKVTLRGSVINVLLITFKFIAGILGNSAAMVADAVHSLSDLITDVIVMLFVHWGNKPKDADHDYGHGKYETLATAIVGLMLLAVGVMVCYNGVLETIQGIRGQILESPGYIALFAAIVSIILKEWAYRFTIAKARKTGSQAVAANAWHHRTDALSSIGTTIGIAGAMFLGAKWRVLDPITAIIVSFFILRVAYQLIVASMNELLEKSLSDDVEAEIASIAAEEEEVSDVHHIMTRRIGKDIAIEMHVRVPGEQTVSVAHEHVCHIEDRLRERFGLSTHIGIHVEPVKDPNPNS